MCWQDSVEGYGLGGGEADDTSGMNKMTFTRSGNLLITLTRITMRPLRRKVASTRQTRLHEHFYFEIPYLCISLLSLFPRESRLVCALRSSLSFFSVLNPAAQTYKSMWSTSTQLSLGLSSFPLHNHHNQPNNEGLCLRQTYSNLS